MNKPLISIILPTYNVGKYMERCLTSCLNQSFDNFEIIIIDDCGVDNSIEVANKYSEKDERIKIISNKENMGTYQARKKGALHAIGDYILYLDPDDELKSGALKIISLQVMKNPELDLLLFNTEYVPKLKFWNMKPKVPVGVFKKNIVNKILKTKNIPYGTMGKLYSKSALIESFQFLSIPNSVRLVYGEDVLVFASVLLNVRIAKGIADEIYVYHLNDTSITNQDSHTSLLNHIEQLELVIRYLGILKSHPNYISTFEYFSKKIEIDKLFMEIKTVKTNKENIEVMLKILSITSCWRTSAKSIVAVLRKKY